MDDTTFNRLYGNFQRQSQTAQPRQNAVKSLLASFLPTIGGAIGAVGGSLIAPVAGTAVGGAGGSALGEALRQRIMGEKSNLKSIGVQGALGAVPGVFKGLKAAKGALTAGEAVVGAEEAATGAANAGRAVAESKAPSLLDKFRSKIAGAGTDLREGVANPQVPAGIGGAQKEAEIAARVGELPGLSAKAKYKSLPAAMDKLTAQIEPELARSKGTVTSEKLLTSIRTNAEKSGHFLAGDSQYEKQLSSVLADLSAKTGGATDLTAKQLYDYKKGMDVKSLFTALDKGGDLNAKQAAQLAVWSSLDDGITTAAPGVKELTKEQSLLMQSPKGLLKSADKTIGPSMLGIKSKKLEEVSQAARELMGRGLEKFGAEGGAKTPSLLGKFVRASGAQAGTRAVAAPLMTAPTPDNQGSTTEMMNPMSITASTNPNMPSLNADQGGNATDYVSAAKQALAAGNYDAFNAIVKLADLEQSSNPSSKPLSTTAAKDVGNAQAGLDSIQIMMNEMQKDPNVVKKAAIPGGGLLGGAGDAIMGTSQFEAAKQQAVDVIARMRTGATINDSEAKTFAGMVPKPFDPPEVAQQKLTQLAQMFATVADRRNTGVDTVAAGA